MQIILEFQIFNYLNPLVYKLVFSLKIADEREARVTEFLFYVIHFIRESNIFAPRPCRALFRILVIISGGERRFLAILDRMMVGNVYHTSTKSQYIHVSQGQFKRRTFHEPNLMQISLNKGFCSLTLDSAHEKFDVRTEPLYALSTINVGKFDSLSLSMCMNS